MLIDTYETLRSVLRLGAASEATTICPEQDRQGFVGRVRRGPDVHVETVLGAAAVDIGVGQGAIVDLSLHGRPLGGGEAQIAGGHGRKADVLVLVVADGGVGGSGHERGIVERDSGCGVGALLDHAGGWEDGGGCCSGEQDGG